MPNPNSRIGRRSHNQNQRDKVECNSNEFKDMPKPLEFPEKTNLPFFAYGIFKPGQLAYDRIEKFVDLEKTYEDKIPYAMHLRDGVPLIEEKESERYVAKGHLIYFKQGYQRNAYKIICNTQSNILYAWKEIEVGGIPSNVLIGFNIERGTSKEIIPDFKGEKDPFFRDVIEIIKGTVEIVCRDKEEYVHVFDEFFKLQMNYLLLWAAIERYSSLKYDIKGDVKVKFANDNYDIIKGVLKDYVDKERKVFNSETLRCNRLDSNNVVGSIFYYYTIRCNVTHHGKVVDSNDYDLLKRSLCELFIIFVKVLSKTFGERKYPFLNDVELNFLKASSMDS